MGYRGVRCRGQSRPGRWRRFGVSLLLLSSLAPVTWVACSDPDVSSGARMGEEESARIVAELRGRSFRQFHPGRESNSRRGVIVEFFGHHRVVLWAQFSEGDRAIHEWEISSENYQVWSGSRESEVTLVLNEPESRRTLPTVCESCLETGGVSISVRDVFDREGISFRINDPEEVLPLPFPVFDSWTRFHEDEYFE